MYTNIYALTEPNNISNIRYIGKANNPKTRYSCHLGDSNDTHKTRWIKSLLKNNQKPILIILDDNIPLDNWESWEIYYIALYRELGFNLTNSTDGGEGCNITSGFTGHKHSESSLIKMRKPRSNIAKDNMRIGQIGRVHSEEQNEKHRQYNINRYKDENERYKTSIATKNGIKKHPQKGNPNLKWKEDRNSFDFSGKNNGMYGKTYFEVWVEKYGYDIAILKQKERSNKIKEYYKNKRQETNDSI